MRIFIPKETATAETRVPIVPATASKLVKLGAEVEVESGLGTSIHASDDDYRAAGATVSIERDSSFRAAGMVLRLRKPSREDIQLLQGGCIHISFLDPFNNLEFVQECANADISAVSLEMIPRSTIAQKMDVLSSQANLGGYVAVILAANRGGFIYPLMMTPAGTIRPAKVFIIGVGVAGLQAIATARRMGAAVSAFDTRPVVEEQVQSLGAKFIKVDLGETGQTEQGYAKALTPEQLEKQREAMAAECAQSDVVITTAQVFGRRAPMIVTTALVEKMKRGSVIVDMAIESGGNVECARLDEEVELNGVRVIGFSNLPGRVPLTASQMYSNNLGAFVEHFWNADTKTFQLDPENALIKGCLLTHGGTICHETIRNLVRQQEQPAAQAAI
jgi:proton-translocating NAD(P)+ transhydrogenase subunit alpha